VDELQAVAVEVGDVGGVVARREVRPVGGTALIEAAGGDRGGVGGLDGVAGVADDAEVEAGLAGLPAAQPDAGSDTGARDVPCRGR